MKHSKVASRDTALLLNTRSDSSGEKLPSAYQFKIHEEKPDENVKINTCTKSLPEVEFKSVTPQD